MHVTFPHNSVTDMNILARCINFVNIDITDFKVCDSPVEILCIVDHLTTICIKKSYLCLFTQNCT